jgi:hypothetical protein
VDRELFFFAGKGKSSSFLKSLKLFSSSEINDDFYLKIREWVEFKRCGDENIMRKFLLAKVQRKKVLSGRFWKILL